MNVATHFPRLGMPRLTRKHLVMLTIGSVLLVGIASAGTTGDEFKELYDNAKDWANGYLGRVIAMLSFLLGAGWSAAKQNMMPVIFGLILAIIISIGPALLEKVLSAVV
ncbi:TraA family conjugative transfer protein [Pseudoduganella umbonata]|uniref:Conjugal transfer pilus assembly protein TraA n=1 Tax=Pseudoduganella umbonata TaxID=864828 RepID=A0A4P8HHY5_9BURK|nr:TraA family conjugative transfer protein [Pseudoduganella umbonata]MBB3221702.1 conjugal transfer pilus assembly protein TraA [Pseudoduganella umbonata]QCP09077.1 hypothetical protein FCL38_00465 [Pseudoduganella umbonata]